MDIIHPSLPSRPAKLRVRVAGALRMETLSVLYLL
jgi:hypothetical protein